ncbi:MAG: WYL domain-containing protein [Alphaproteobacteria bacterium]|nr:WYL domain-containing protein [Alphaproteobacteria bacterium]
MSYEKTEQLLDLAIWMQSSREGVSLKDIMKRFNVSKRTADRMRDLILARFPQAVEVASDTREKRWCIPQGTLRDMIQFNAEELSCLHIAQEALEKSHLHDKASALAGIVDKIRASIKQDTFRRIEPDAEELMRAEGIACRPGPKIKIDEQILNPIREAILSCHQIRVTYLNKNTGKTSYNTLNPLGFLYGERNHYLVAQHGNGFGGLMPHNFILMNIKAVTVLPDTFVYPKDFSLRTYAAQSFGAFQETPVDVEWLFDKEVADEASHYIFHPSQTMTKNPDGTLTVRFRAGGRMEMDWHLYTWGGHVTVIKPVS